MIALVIPVAVRSNIPIRIPVAPDSFVLSRAPWIRRCPKLVIGTSAPPPTKFIILSYILKLSKNAPITTKRLVMCPADSLVLSRIICAIIQIIPVNRNEYI